MKKSLKSLSIAVLILLGLVGEQTKAHGSGDNIADTITDGKLYFEVTSDSTVKVINNYSYANLSNVNIPSSVSHGNKTFTVNAVDNGAFPGLGIQSVVFPNSMQVIGDSSFYNCYNLTTITIPENVKVVGNKAFALCTKLQTVNYNAIRAYNATVYKSEYDIVGSMFDRDTNISTVNIGNHVEVIPNGFLDEDTIRIWDFSYTYYDSIVCRFPKINTITIPASVKEFGLDCFHGIKQLKTLNYNAKAAAFVFQKRNAWQNELNGLYDITSRIYYDSYDFQLSKKHIFGSFNITTVNIGDSVEAIPDKFLLNQINLSSVTIPDGVRIIGDSAFMNTGLTEITIPSTVDTIGTEAFADLPSLTKVNFNAKNCYYKASYYSQNHSMFYADTNISEINFGENVEVIPDKLFKQELKNIADDKGDYLYTDTLDFNKIKSLSLPESVKTIGDLSLTGLGITDLTIPAAVESIGVHAFSDNKSLTTVNFNAVNCTHDYSESPFSESVNISSFIFADGVKRIPQAILYGPMDIMANFDYQTQEYIFDTIADNRFKKITKIEIPSSVTFIGENAFANCIGLTSVTIPENVDTIERYVFPECTNLDTLNYNAVNASCGSYVFSTNPTITKVNIGSNVEKLDEGLFRNFLTDSIILPNSLKSIGSNVFRGCKNLKTVTIPENVEKIGEQAFADCTSLDTVRWNAINASYIYDEDYEDEVYPMFDGDTNISAFIFGDKVENIPAKLLQGRTLNYNPYNPDQDSKFISKFHKINKIILPNSVKNIGTYAFSNCGNLSYLELGTGVAKIDKKAFAFCENMDTIVSYAEVPPTIYSSTFEEVLNTIPVFVPCGAMNTYKSAAWWNMFANYTETGCNKEIVTVNIEASICEGETYNFNGRELSVAGEYKDTVHVNMDKDSIIVLTLTAHQTYSVSAEETRILEDATMDEYDEVIIDTLQSQFGCDSIVTTTIHYKHDSGIDGITETVSLNIYPNPAKDKVTLDIGHLILDGDKVITIINNAGQVVYKSDIQSQQLDINIKDFKAGIYYIKVGKFTQPLIIE
ncbi:MAG: leucine-rich repeat protein [Bacteroidales bacterium]|nr:leucine-rich repeat protein [Bacteroidales bacterium]